MRRMLIYIIAAALGIVSAFGFTAMFSVASVVGMSMEPAIVDGSKVLVNKMAYSNTDAEPAVGDVIAFHTDVFNENGEGRLLVRRVAGISADTVEIKDDAFYLNGRIYNKYMKEPVHMEDMKKINLKDNEIFVLSDNRKYGVDSRTESIGVIKKEDCIGKVLLDWKGLR